jgi:hypothetical protein
MAEVHGQEVMDMVKLIAGAVDGYPEPIIYSALIAMAILMLSDKISGDDVKDGVVGASKWLNDFVDSRIEELTPNGNA